MANLAIKIANVFGPKLYQTFNVSSDKSPGDILDMVKYQWQMCQRRFPSVSNVQRKDLQQ